MLHDNRNRSDAGPEPAFRLISPTRFALQSWLFRLAVVGTAYLTVAVCAWLLDAAPSPWLQAIPPALGVVLGFLLLHLIDLARRRILK